jgi:hypothetical protein
LSGSAKPQIMQLEAKLFDKLKASMRDLDKDYAMDTVKI